MDTTTKVTRIGQWLAAYRAAVGHRLTGDEVAEACDAAEAIPAAFHSDSAFTLGVIAGAACALDLTVRELVDALDHGEAL